MFARFIRTARSVATNTVRVARSAKTPLAAMSLITLNVRKLSLMFCYICGIGPTFDTNWIYRLDFAGIRPMCWPRPCLPRCCGIRPRPRGRGPGNRGSGSSDVG
jgi:hypothetical protein